MSGFTKLFSSILTSSIWVEDDATFRVWIALLALCDWHGRAEGSVPGLASLCRMSIEATEQALARLSAPDPYSRTPDHEGRRILPVDGGWDVVNYVKYRERQQSKPGSRAEYMRGYRQSPTAPTVTCNSEMLHVIPVVTRNTDKDKETDTETDNGNGIQGAGKSVQRDLLPLAPKETLSTSSTAAAVRRVFEHWQTAMNKPRARLDEKRRRLINARLADGYSAEALCQAVDGCRRSLWHQGANDRGRRYVDLDLICRDAKHVDEFIEIATHGEAKPMSNLEIHNARVLGLIGEPDPEDPFLALPKPEDK